MRSRAGSLLVITLWLVTILSVLAIAIARALSIEVRLAKRRLAHEQAKVLARSGVYLAMQRLAHDAQQPEADGKTYDWLGDDWAFFPQPEAAADATRWVMPVPADGAAATAIVGEISVQIVDEDRKLHLNTATKEELVTLTHDAVLAQAIVDVRDEPDPAEDRPNDQPPYMAKNGPIVAREELSDLAGMTRDLQTTLDDATSPYTAAGDPLNVNTVTPTVLRAIGVSESAIQLLTQFRDGPDGALAHERDGVFEEAGLAILQTLKDRQGVDLTGTPDGNLLASDRFGVSSQTFIVVSEGRVERPPLLVRVEAVMRRTACGDGVPAPCIVAWREG